MSPDIWVRGFWLLLMLYGAICAGVLVWHWLQDRRRPTTPVVSDRHLALSRYRRIREVA